MREDLDCRYSRFSPDLRNIRGVNKCERVRTFRGRRIPLGRLYVAGQERSPRSDAGDILNREQLAANLAEHHRRVHRRVNDLGPVRDPVKELPSS